MQDKFGKTGKFAVITSHLTQPNKRALKGILKKNKITFPVFLKLMLTKAPAESVPHVVLFDQEGNIVEQDWKIDNLEEKIAKLLSVKKK